MGNAWVMGALSTAMYFVSSPTAAIRKHIRPHRLPHPVLSSFSRPIVCLSSLLPRFHFRTSQVCIPLRYVSLRSALNSISKSRFLRHIESILAVPTSTHPMNTIAKLTKPSTEEFSLGKGS